MARMQVYLPDATYKLVKAKGLPVSELLQRAVEAELRRQELLEETDRYLAELIAEVGEPSPKERARIQAAVRRVTRPHARKAG
jgi:post-segregation antitoxin (ccd killing protein)